MRAILLAAVLLSAAAVTAAPAGAETVDEDLVPGGTILSTIFPAGEIETFRISAPAGSVLSVDLRPAKKGAFAPLLVATLSDGSAGVVPALSKSGKTRAKLPFPVDGVLQVLVLSGRGGAGDYTLKTKLKVPKGPELSGVILGPEGVTFEYMAPAGALATVTVKTYGVAELIPTIDALEAPGGAAAPFKRNAGLRFDRWSGVPQPELGPWTLTVVGNLFTEGPFTGTVRFKAPRGPDEDHRAVSLPTALQGSYAALLLTADASSGSLPALLTGGIEFDGRGLASTDLDRRGLSTDPGSPFGIGFATTPVEPATGSYYTDGALAAVTLDLADNLALNAEFTVAAGGDILYSGVGPAISPATGLVLARTPVPAAAELAGSWLYMNATTDTEGASSVEVGTFALGSGGTVSGFGARTALTVVDGTPTPGAQTAVLRTGSFSVGKDGTITIVTDANFSGNPESWTSKTAFRADILAGLDATGGGGRLLLRRGLGLSEADVDGDYLHFGLSFGSALRLRTGILAFDGSGGFSGDETVTDLTGAVPPSSAPVTGTYSVDDQGLATFGISGEADGQGVVGPEASYLFTVSFAEGGVGLDLLLDLE